MSSLRWFTADQHWGHANIISYTNRPFIDVLAMDERMIADWNAVVAKSDIVYHLGDFTLENADFAEHILRCLNGNICMLSYPWHHDRHWLRAIRDWQFTFQYLAPLVVLELEDYRINDLPAKLTLCHYPLEEWEAGHYGAYCIHGHSHGVKDAARTKPILDVGVDNAYRLLGTWRPFSLDEVVKICQSRKGN